MLIFPLKKQWYEKIKSGEKMIEYRKTSEYWKSRLTNAYCNSVPFYDELCHWINSNYDNAFYVWDGFVESACEGITCNITCILRLGYTKTKMTARIKRIEAVPGENTDLHLQGKLVFALHLTDVKQKMSIREEIKFIHDQYNLGNKFVKPSFNYIVVIAETFGRHGDDFYVSNHLDKAKEKALELLCLTKDWVEIYKVEEFNDGYKAREVLTINSFDKIFREGYINDRPMHIAWRTRGECMNEKEQKNDKNY